ncbi:11750_t:CDS:2 [Paraglomus brasilianum]|uniref:11750_t:CDS:1 n=1 Tax=Paraglomus brasilianum TaxID=144538 RepID=A0A9N8W3X2_9GLOM|nr:11750_t:CDS:2 [Paraglomus brasilianum]
MSMNKGNEKAPIDFNFLGNKDKNLDIRVEAVANISAMSLQHAYNSVQLTDSLNNNNNSLKNQIPSKGSQPYKKPTTASIDPKTAKVRGLVDDVDAPETKRKLIELFISYGGTIYLSDIPMQYLKYFGRALRYNTKLTSPVALAKMQKKEEELNQSVQLQNTSRQRLERDNHRNNDVIMRSELDNEQKVKERSRIEYWNPRGHLSPLQLAVLEYVFCFRDTVGGRRAGLSQRFG